MKRIIIGLILLLAMSCFLTGCYEDELPQKINPLANTDANPIETENATPTEATENDEHDVVTTTYIYEREGAGSEFTISLKDDGTFLYYPGALSSSFHEGTWTAEGNEFHLVEKGDNKECNYYFYKQDSYLEFIKEYSDDFSFVDVPDGGKFRLSEDN